MKKKILLLISLVLLTVQGWATPIDSLDTQSSGSGLFKLNGKDLIDASALSNGLEQKKKFDVLDSYAPWPLNIFIASIDIIQTNDVSFCNIPVGASVTKEFELSSEDITQVAENLRKMHNLIRSINHAQAIAEGYSDSDSVFIPYAASVKIRVKISPTNAIPGDNIIDGITADRDSLYKEMFSLDNDLINPVEIRNGKSKIINLTFRPSVAGKHEYEFVFSYEFFDQEGNNFFSLVKYVPIIQPCGLSQDMASAVKGTITTDKSQISFLNAPVGQTQTEHLTVTGKNLSGPLTLTCSGVDQDKFWLYPDHITAEDAENDVDVTVKYVSLVTGNHNATLTISGGGADSVFVGLSGKCVANPTISVNTTSLDMGSTYVGTPLTGTFTITGSNLSEAITLVQPWSETIGGEFSISPTTLPKTGGTVTVTYNPSDAHTSGAAFKFKSGNMFVNVCVTAKGLAVPRIITNPSSLDYETVAKNSNNTKKFTVRGYDLTGDLTITPTSSSYFTVSPTTITAAQAMSSNGVEVTVTYKPTAAGNHSATFTISGNGATSKTVSVSGKCASLTASTTSLDMETTYVGTPKTATFTITGVNLSEAITLVQPWSETIGGEFSISPTTLPKTGGTVTVTYTPSGAHTSGAAFKFKSGDFIVNIAVTAKGISTPKITTSVSSLHFSAAVSKTFKVTGTNLTGSLTVKSSNSKFTVSPSTISAADAAAGKTVTVTYHDTNGATNASGTITISGGGASSKTVSVTYAKGQDVQINPVYPDSGSEEGNNEFTNGGSLESSLNSTTDVNELAMNSKVYAEGLNIIIESPMEQIAIISDISGRARSVNLQAGRNEIPVNASGIYIVRIREKTIKLMLK